MYKESLNPRWVNSLSIETLTQKNYVRDMVKPLTKIHHTKNLNRYLCSIGWTKFIRNCRTSIITKIDFF